MSAFNTQPWHFVVVRDRETIAALGRIATQGAFIGQAPLAITIVMENARRPQLDAGRATRHDDEYERKGTCGILLAFEPLRDWRFVQIRKQRTAVDYAAFMQELVETYYPAVERIQLVNDNLHTHTPGVFYHALAPQEAFERTHKFILYYTTIKGSWLNKEAPKEVGEPWYGKNAGRVQGLTTGPHRIQLPGGYLLPVPWRAAPLVRWLRRQRVELGAERQPPDDVGRLGQLTARVSRGIATVSQASDGTPGHLPGREIEEITGQLTAGTIRHVELLGLR